MKNPNTPFATQYPYLAYWINEWGYIKMGNSEYTQDENAFLILMDGHLHCVSKGLSKAKRADVSMTIFIVYKVYEV